MKPTGMRVEALGVGARGRSGDDGGPRLVGAQGNGVLRNRR